jgi:hypothetical protein
MCFPPFFKTLPRERRQSSGLRPDIRGIKPRAFDQAVQRLEDSSNLYAEGIQPWPVHDERHPAKDRPLFPIGLLAGAVAAVLEQVMS